MLGAAATARSTGVGCGVIRAVHRYPAADGDEVDRSWVTRLTSGDERRWRLTVDETVVKFVSFVLVSSMLV